MILLFKLVHKNRAEGWLLQPYRDVMCLIEKIRVLDKLHSGMSYGAVGHELNVNESKTILNKRF